LRGGIPLTINQGDAPVDVLDMLRLLDEVNAVLEPSQIEEIALSMDLAPDEVRSQLDEASRGWETIKDARG
jgi:hypothetical protein